MLNIIAIGSATRDIFINAENLKKGKGFSFLLGEKVEVKEVRFFSGGGGVNVATTFALQGSKTGFCGVVGEDLVGQELIGELKKKGIDTNLLKTRKGKATDLGIIFHAKNERTIILFHGASRTLDEKNIDWKKLKETGWLYIAPLWGKAADLTEKLLDFSKENKIKVALNPSLDQLSLKNISKIIAKTNVLILNSKEACFLTKINPFREKDVFKKISSLTKALTIITKGKQGASLLDQRFLYQVASLPVKVVDATGAGDSFGSGFVAGLIRFKNTEKALRLAMANAISNIRVFGANQGLLKKGDKIHDIKITKQTIN